MYLNIKESILSRSILLTALVKMLAAFVEGNLRFLIRRDETLTPDMLDRMIWNVQTVSSIVQIIVITLIFYYSWKRLYHYINLIPLEDRREMGALQQQYLGKRNATLSAESVSRLLQLWAVIFVGAELVYSFSSLMYRKFIATLMTALAESGGASNETFLMLYNMTHGFKYLEILGALLLGVVMTGIFLSDRYLKAASLIILVLFLLAFGIFQMQTLSFWGREIGIVWTSIIYHFTETIGLVILSFYLTKKYKGL